MIDEREREYIHIVFYVVSSRI